MADFLITSLRGGMNDTDPPIALPDDQCVLAQNVEFTLSTLGERRRGGSAITLTSSGLDTKTRVTFLHRYLPTTDESDAELWGFGHTDASTYALARKDTSWHNVPFVDNPLLTSGAEYNFQAVNLHGKLFLAYKSAQDRLHVWDGSTLRRAGLAPPTAAPTGANTGSGSFAATVRYYRVREIVQSGSTILRRSEPSPVLTFTPSGSGTGVVVTKPADMGESATHWELEASLNNADFYRIATTVVGTTTATDSSASYAATFTLSDDSGDDTAIYSGEFLSADEDRVLIGGSFNNSELASRVSWTPVYKDVGVGNDERIPVDTVNFLDLDGFEGGRLTGISGPVNGAVWAFKRSHIYKLVRTGDRSRAYDPISITKKRGALKGSIVEAVDQQGRPALYFLDPTVGPCRLGASGLQACGNDILTTWKTVNTNAANVVCRGIYYPDARQVHWWVATGSNDSPVLRIVLQTNVVEDHNDGARRGWAKWDGPSAQALAVCLYSSNIEAGTARNTSLVPLIGGAFTGRVWRTDTTDADNGTAYTARITSKPYTPLSILHKFGVMAAAFVAKAVVGGLLDIVATRDFGLETKTISGTPLDPSGSETHVIKQLDDLGFSELRVVQVDVKDPTVAGARWELHQIALKERREQTG